MMETSSLPIDKVCKTLGVSRQAFYHWKKQTPPTDADKGILRSIQDIALEFPKYGYRRITHALHREGLQVNHKRVHRIMKENNILVRRKKYKPVTTQSNHGLPKYQNHAKDFIPTAINQLFVADITYIQLRAEFVYLAMIMDLFSRRCVG